MKSFFKTPAEVKRKTYIDNKSSTITTGNIYKGFLKPLSLADGIEEGAFWKEFRFTTFIDSDIKQGDILAIEWEDYSVKWVAKKRALREIFYLQCLISKW